MVEFCKPRLAAIRSPLAAALFIKSELLFNKLETLPAIVCDVSFVGD